MDYFLSADFLVGFTMMVVVGFFVFGAAYQKAGKAGIVTCIILAAFFTMAYGAKHVIG